MWHIGIAGGDGKKKKFMLKDKNNRVVKGQKYNHGSGELTQTSFIRNSRFKVSAFASGTKDGCIQVLAHPYHEGGISQQLSHKGAITKLQSTIDFNYFFSAGRDGVLYIYKVETEKVPSPDELNMSSSQMRPESGTRVPARITLDKEEDEPKPLMKPALASVVLCSQFQMEQWADKKQQLESDLENVKRMVESSLADCEKRYDA